MKKFESITSVIAPLPMSNVDTDMIIPKQFLTTTKRTGLKEGLFFELRYDRVGKPIKDFVLNKSKYDSAKILVSLDNFGCGSSREHAVWALVDHGFECVIAPSYAEIFFGNCFKNGVLPIRLKHEEVVEILEKGDVDGATVSVDLPSQEVRLGDKIYKFQIDPFQKRCLMLGLDQIALTLESKSKIVEFEADRKKRLPWL